MSLVYDLFIGNKNYSSWSLRPWVLMRELNIPFREKLVPFGGAQNPHAFRDFSPTGKVPCLVDGSTTVWDSLAITEYLGGRAPEVEKVSWSKNTVWVDKAQTAGFKGVREDVWNFHVGGYQVCEKWLKGRKGRTLSKNDIAH